MPKSQGQKLKALRIKDIFEQKTDENHPIGIQDILDELLTYGIEAERKSLYRDINSLREYGMDIRTNKGRNYTYYLANREFDLAELKMLTDAVSASKFIPVRTGNKLIKKLGKLTSEYKAEGLKRQLYAEKASYTGIDGVLSNVEKLYGAIDRDSKIQFRYYSYTMHKNRQYRHNGKFYIISPWAMVWNDGMYYLIGYDSDAKEIRHYRVDKMANITINETLRRDGQETFADFDIKRYTKRIFGMYGGQVRDVKMCCHKSLSDVIIDRFGIADAVMKPIDDEHFIVKVKAAISPVFISWTMGFGNKLEVLEPKCVRNEIRDTVKLLTEVYVNEN